ncbi:subtilisin-like protease SBT4.14 [Cucurbita maxima]|uniref:Subtilisin-like protease SBT4.14 n=1 Tax=Cucurbita maxima TaxID=3661 RepID=A0A6J1IN55_CUCMA|nr:subtilisin-like protease SBT4.14 [Cucurbita maxima]
MLISISSRVLVCVLLFVVGCVDAVEIDEEKKHFIVFLEMKPGLNEFDAVETHLNVLMSVKESYVEAEESMVYSYTKSFNAFAAKLTEEEALALSKREDVHHVIPNRYRKLQTTRSWDFIGLSSHAKRNSKETDIIVGLFDTGITPTADSFKDDGFGPPPTKWKGTCHHFANFTGCNKKLIGARYFKLDGNTDPADILSPIDVDGHGTHTSSTATGNAVAGASLSGLAKGTARGGVPSARVAMYKVCWASTGCADMDILAAFDAAIHDGVDVISISIGGGAFGNYSDDSISIGAFHAMKKGIITVTSAGNDGPTPGSVVNHAPWIVTVGASAIDRKFISLLELGNGKNISGVGINIFNPKKKMYPLVYGGDVARGAGNRESASHCEEDSLDPSKVKGSLVFCELITWGVDSVVSALGANGAIIQSNEYLDNANIFMAPATMVSSSVGAVIHSYIKSTRTPTAVIYKTRQLKAAAPMAASFSSRGPNPGTTRILKPDIAAPGVDILAGYTPLKSLTGQEGDTQFSKFTLMSGTSMACPHVAAAAAYVKSFHPLWSPGAIRSALITTASQISRRLNPDGEFAYGAGNLNPSRAINPGLIYDLNEMSYIQFLCSEGYTGFSISVLTGTKSINCSTLIPGHGHDSLNYPTFQLRLKSPRRAMSTVFRRRVTNVSHPVSVYNATIKAPPGVEITVTPSTLSFSRLQQKRSFKVAVKASPLASGKMVSGSVAWIGARHAVRSPIVVYSPEDEEVFVRE